MEEQLPPSTLIKEKYPMLTEEEISAFMSCHSWLADEKDQAIIENYLEDYFKSMATRYNSIIDSIEKMKKAEKEAEAKNKEEEKKSQETQDDFEELLNNLQNLHKDLYELKNQRDQFYTIIKYFNLIVESLFKNIKDANFRQLSITNPQLKEDAFLSMLNNLGFDIALYSETEILLILNKEPSEEILSIILDMLASLYLQNQKFLQEVGKDLVTEQRLEAQRIAPQAREMDRATFLAAKHEQRVSGKYHPSSIQRVNNDPSLKTQPLVYVAPTHSSIGSVGGNAQQQQNLSPEQLRAQIYSKDSYLADTETMKGQIDDYRQKMRVQFMDNRKFKKGNMMTLTDMNNRDKAQDQIPRAPGTTQSKKFMTGRDIEEMRIEEDKVKFGLRCLELTNQFRKSNGLQPCVWSQELCDIGMPHSQDMAHGRVPFSHVGFDRRSSQVKFAKMSMAENLAYNQGYSDPPKSAVDGWITSPGHRKNLLSSSNVCGIACYRAPNGSWYFTQLFAMRL